MLGEVFLSLWLEFPDWDLFSTFIINNQNDVIVTILLKKLLISITKREYRLMHIDFYMTNAHYYLINYIVSDLY